MLTERDKKLNLSGKSLNAHLLWENNTHKDVSTAFMLHEIQQDDKPTPCKTITKYTKTFNMKMGTVTRSLLAVKYVCRCFILWLQHHSRTPTPILGQKTCQSDQFFASFLAKKHGSWQVFLHGKTCASASQTPETRSSLASACKFENRVL